MHLIRDCSCYYKVVFHFEFWMAVILLDCPFFPRMCRETYPPTASRQHHPTFRWVCAGVRPTAKVQVSNSAWHVSRWAHCSYWAKFLLAERKAEDVKISCQFTMSPSERGTRLLPSLLRKEGRDDATLVCGQGFFLQHFSLSSGKAVVQ